jgi:butyryl-CoA dehydrogenase
MYKKLGAAGFIGYVMPTELGGQGKSHLEYITLVEELCYHDPGVGLLCAVGELATHPLIHFGSDEIKKKYVEKCAKGDIVPAFVLTEPEAGSDAANQKTEAEETDDGFVINGEKIFIMHGDAADVGVVFCKVKDKPKLSAIVVDTDQPGWEARTLKNKMGMRAATTGGIVLKDVKAPKENLLGEFGKGFRYAMTTLDSARIGVAAQGVGIAQRALDESVAYSKKRIAFGQPIAKLQAIQWMIADMATRLEAARGLCYKAAQMQDRGERYSLEAAQAKLFCSETANFCVDRAMQIHAGYGYIGEFSMIEKLYRDQRVLEIYEGTSEVQRLVIAGNVIGR